MSSPFEPEHVPATWNTLPSCLPILRSTFPTAVVRDERVLMSNPAMARLLGYPSVESLRDAPLVAVIQDPSRVLEPPSGPMPVTLLDDAGRSLDTPAWTRSCEETGLTVLFAGEIRQLKQLQLQVQQTSLDALQARSARRMVHDLRNMSTVVAMLLPQMRGDLQALAQTHRSARRLLLARGHGTDGARVASALSTRLLEEEVEELIYVEQHMQEILEEWQQVSTSAVDVTTSLQLEGFVKALRRTARFVVSQPVELEVRSSGQILANEGALFQVMLNLVINAGHAMDDAGATGPIVVRLSCTSTTAHLEVVDRGAGIPPEHIPRLFEEGFTTKPHGSGLGLTNCKAIIDDLGGRIEIDSRQGVGTTVSIELPLADAAQRTTPREGSPRPRVLVVDDRTSLRHQLYRELAASCTVHTARDGLEAISLISRTRFDAILCRWSLPEVSGADVVRWIRGHRSEMIHRIALLGRPEHDVHEARGLPFLQHPSRLGMVRPMVENLRTQRPSAPQDRRRGPRIGRVQLQGFVVEDSQVHRVDTVNHSESGIRIRGNAAGRVLAGTHRSILLSSPSSPGAVRAKLRFVRETPGDHPSPDLCFTIHPDADSRRTWMRWLVDDVGSARADRPG